MSGRFTGALQGVSEEPRAQAPAPAPEPAGAELVRVERVAEPLKLVQGRVTHEQRKAFAREMLDIQDYFHREVTQEEGIAALLVMVTRNAEARTAWIRTIQAIREEKGQG